jgi:hypothetical protein
MRAAMLRNTVVAAFRLRRYAPHQLWKITPLPLALLLLK